ncbi:MAG: DUF3997 domain-containing protein [Mediterranea sp.]|jgi:hypothetical protein|nr:DUF3997 domain-containing protein [Mediterranea sp.]
MDKIKKQIAIFACGLITIVGLACNWSDYSEDLGNGYTYAHEGQGCNTIFHEYPTKGGEIPPDVLSFNYNKQYIIAMQKRQRDYERIAGVRKISYPLGLYSIFYWIIKKEHKVLGPLTLEEFDSLRVQYKVPKELVLH